MPSASQTREPRPWLIQTAWGREICQLEVTPPARDPAARSSSSRERGWRSMNRCSWTAISSSRRVPTDTDTVMAVSYPVSRPTPRLASWPAMIARWISEVPSQILSTRSSR